MKDCMMLWRIHRDQLVPLTPEENRQSMERIERPETAGRDGPGDAALLAPPRAAGIAWQFAW